MAFLFLERMIANQVHPIAINPTQVIALHPAVSFDHYGKATFAGGTDIWTVPMAEGSSAWRVVEDYGTVTGALADLARQSEQSK